MADDPKVDERPGEARDGEGRPAPKFSAEDVLRARKDGAPRRSSEEIVRRDVKRFAETLKALGE
ncbi:hypothetical protein [Stappia indica]|uniref:Uncharacterized protein n=1 Tax=Stappia indica TaxID=538381 RepID=A0A857C4E2_9HYPH|nr:hypothetical protein [Stappia indica]QGZ33807.1 hypothetical protein GH266_04355 [Stappia indica]